MAVVTGAARGFGLQIARRLAGRDHHVVLTDIDPAVRDVAAELGGTGVVADARGVEDHRRVAATAAEHGRITVWVNNAGVLRAAKTWEHDDGDVELMVAANLLGVIHGSRVAVGAMRNHGGHLLNIASMSAHGPVPGLAVYAATKAGVVNFTASLQGDLDLAGLPIRAHALCPDVADTALVRAARAQPEAAILFAQRGMLDAGTVADAALTLLDGQRVLRSLPGYRAALARVAGMLPRVGLPVLARMRGVGERHRVGSERA